MLLKKVHYPIVGILILLLIVSFEVYLYYSELDFERTSSTPIPLYESWKTFILPSSFSDKNFDLYKHKLSGANYYRYNRSGNPDKVLKIAKESDYHQHEISVYNSDENIDGDNSRCPALNQITDGVLVDKSKNLDLDLIQVMNDFVRDLPNNLYYQEIAPYFLDRMQEFFDKGEEKQINRVWYQLAGSSVWLEDYGVHFMIRRLLYSPVGQRTSPILSLTYAQIFDSDWNELKDTHLVTSDNSKLLEPESLKFPSFIKIPFYHDPENLVERNYGPEDPRITLYKNEFGLYEPIIIFNSFHRKFDLGDDGEDLDQTKPKFYRSMWILYPFKIQLGKYNTDGARNDKYDNSKYAKVKELRIKDLFRKEKQKNWTPFTSYTEQIINHEDNFDRFIYFVYRWSHFEVLRCDVKSGVCDFEYKLNPTLPPNEEVGELRGGTPLISINELLSKLGIDTRSYIPFGREVWLGFARAHIDWCGCGPVMYRPNMVLVVKDEIPKELGYGQYDKVYKLSHVSSSISFDVDIIGWEADKPTKKCWFNNILIPNGISWWVANFDSELKIFDYMELTLSASDATVEKITIKNLLAVVLKFKGIFLGTDSEPYIPTSTIPSEMKGYNNDNIQCAMLQSRDFCSLYSKDNPDPDAKD